MTDADVEQRLRTAREWAGLTSHGRVLISIEPRGLDIQTLVDHELVHDQLMRTSNFGLLQIFLAGLAEPGFPSGTAQRRARQLLAMSIQASVGVQEACATFLPALDRRDEGLRAYWDAVPAGYKELVAPLEWLRRRQIDAPSVRRLVHGLGHVALCPPIAVDWASHRLSEAKAWAAYLSDTKLNPNDRFTSLARSLSAATDAQLVELGSEWDSMVAALVDRWYPTPTGEGVPYQSWPSGTDSIRALMLDMAASVVQPWIDESRAAEKDAKHLELARAGAFIRPMGEAVLNLLLTRTVAETGTIWDNPPLDWILPYELAEISVNPTPDPKPGVESTSGRSLPLEMGEGAMWLRSAQLPNAACRLSEHAVVDYLDRVDLNRTTLCVDDPGYLFVAAGVLPAPNVLRGKPHIVLVTARTPHSLLESLDQWDTAGTYFVQNSDFPGAAYLLMRPVHDLYPIVVLPLPTVAAHRMTQVLGHGGHHGPWPRARSLADVVESDPVATAHVHRTIAMFENKPWPRPRVNVSLSDVLGQATRAGGAPTDAGQKSDYERLVELERSLHMLMYSRVGEHLRAGRKREALDELTRARQRNPRDPYVSMNRGVVLEQLGRYDEALADYDDAVRLDPSLAVAYLNRGNTYALLGRDTDALREYTDAITRDVAMKDAYLQRAFVHGRLGQPREAIVDFDRAAALDPKDAEAYSGRGLAYADRHEYRKAFKDFSRAIRLDPRNAQTYLRRGKTWERAEQYRNAVADYTEAIRLRPDLVEAYEFRGRLYGQQRRYDLSLPDFIEAVKLDPQNPDHHYNRGLSHLGLHDLGAAKSAFQRVVELDPEHAEAHYNIGVLLYNEGAPAQALSHFERAQASGDPQAADAIRRIKSEL